MKLQNFAGRSNVEMLPLFTWAKERDHRARMTYPARWLRRRHALPENRAILIADLYGFGGGQ